MQGMLAAKRAIFTQLQLFRRCSLVLVRCI